MSDDAPRKRSRFDKTEPATKSSRFDRRSRSPSGQKSESRRSRSPVDTSDKTSSTPEAKAAQAKDSKAAAATAAAAAARINAQIQAKKASGEYNPATIKTVNTPGSAKSPSAKNDIYQQDGDFIKDIEVNDLRNRYTLTKGSTQKMIKEETGADVTTRGNYYPDKSMATAAQPPLYLHVTSQTKEGLQKAIDKINDMMQQDLPNLVDERRFRRREPREEPERDEYGRRKWPEEKIPIDLEPIPGFNLRAQVVGQQGMYVKHVQTETGCRVQIKGRGSGFHEKDTNMESDEQMYLHVSAPHPDQVQRGKALCEELLESVRQRYTEHKTHGPPHRGPPGGRGGYDRGHDQRDSYGGHHRDSQSHDSYNQNPMSPSAAADPNAGQYGEQNMSQEDQYAMMRQYAEYYAQNPDQDPYKDFGGYGAYVNNYYQQMYAPQGQQGGEQQQQQQYGYNYPQGYGAGSPTPAANPYGQAPPPSQQGYNAGSSTPGAAAHEQAPPPPPPPPASEQPPPPPPPPGSSNGYNSVPPPPGL